MAPKVIKTKRTYSSKNTNCKRVHLAIITPQTIGIEQVHYALQYGANTQVSNKSK